LGWLGFQSSSLAKEVLDAPYSDELRLFNPIRIKGKITSNGKGIPNVGVSDGRVISKSNSNGEFELVSGSDKEFVFVILPSGYTIEKQANGSASFFKKIDTRYAEQNFSFELKPLRNSDGNHHFLLLSDTQIQNEYEANQLLTVSIPDVQKTIHHRIVFVILY